MLWRVLLARLFLLLNEMKECMVAGGASQGSIGLVSGLKGRRSFWARQSLQRTANIALMLSRAPSPDQIPCAQACLEVHALHGFQPQAVARLDAFHNHMEETLAANCSIAIFPPQGNPTNQ
jgi:hypothetical protein